MTRPPPSAGSLAARLDGSFPDGGDRYLTPLAHDCAVVEAALDPGAVVVLLGSIDQVEVTPPYALADVFGR